MTGASSVPRASNNRLSQRQAAIIGRDPAMPVHLELFRFQLFLNGSQQPQILKHTAA